MKSFTGKRLISVLLLLMLLIGMLPAGMASEETIRLTSAPVPLFVRHEVIFYVAALEGFEEYDEASDDYFYHERGDYYVYSADGFENPQSILHGGTADFPDMTGVPGFIGWSVEPDTAITESVDVFALYESPEAYAYYQIEVFIEGTGVGASGYQLVRADEPIQADAGKPLYATYKLPGNITGYRDYVDNSIAPTVISATVPEDDFRIAKIDGEGGGYYYVIIETDSPQDGKVQVKLPSDLEGGDGTAAYTVVHHLEDPNGPAGDHTYTPTIIESLRGVPGEKVDIAPLDGDDARVEGYTFNAAKADPETINQNVSIMPDGSTSVDLYYDLEVYTITVHLNDDFDLTKFSAEGNTAEQLAELEAAMNVPANYTGQLQLKRRYKQTLGTIPSPQRAGYRFDKWYVGEPANGTAYAATGTMGRGDMDVYANWNPSDVAFSVRVHVQKVQGGYDYVEYDQFTDYEFAPLIQGEHSLAAPGGSMVTIDAGAGKNAADVMIEYGDEKKTRMMPGDVYKNYMTLNVEKSDMSVMVKPDGTSVLNLYVDRFPMAFTIYKTEGGVKVDGSDIAVNMPWGADLTPILRANGITDDMWYNAMAAKYDNSYTTDNRNELWSMTVPCLTSSTKNLKIAVEVAYAVEPTIFRVTHMLPRVNDSTGLYYTNKQLVVSGLVQEDLYEVALETEHELYNPFAVGNTTVTHPTAVRFAESFEDNMFMPLKYVEFTQSPTDPLLYEGTVYYGARSVGLYWSTVGMDAVSGASNGKDYLGTYTIGQKLSYSSSPPSPTFWTAASSGYATGLATYQWVPTKVTWDEAGEIPVNGVTVGPDGGTNTYAMKIQSSMIMPNPYPESVARMYVHFGEKTFTVTFMNGSTTVSTQKIAYDGTAEMPDDPVKEGYTFSGWYTAEGEAFDANTKVEGNTTVSAKWVKNTGIYNYTVYYMSNGEEIFPALTGSAVEGSALYFAAPVVEGYVLSGQQYMRQTVMPRENSWSFEYYTPDNGEGRFYYDVYIERLNSHGYERSKDDLYDRMDEYDMYIERYRPLGEHVDLLEEYPELFPLAYGDYVLSTAPSKTSGYVTTNGYDAIREDDYQYVEQELQLNVYYDIVRESYKVEYWDMTGDTAITTVPRNNIKRGLTISESARADNELFAKYTYEGWESMSDSATGGGTGELATAMIADSSTVIRFNFSRGDYEIVTAVEGNGVVAPSGAVDSPVTVTAGEDQTFTFTPDAGNELDYILVDGNRVNAVDLATEGSYTFENVTADHVLVAYFKVANQYSLSLRVEGDGALASTPAAGDTVPENWTGKISQQAGQNYRLTKLRLYENATTTMDETGIFDIADGGAVPVEIDLTVTSDTEVVASFGTLVVYGAEETADGKSYGVTLVYESHPDDIIEYSTNGGFNWTTEPPLYDQPTDGDGVEVLVRVRNDNYGEDNGRVIAGSADIIINPPPVTYYEITASVKGRGGEMSPVGAFEAAEGSDVVFTFTTETGYMVDEVIVNGVPQPYEEGSNAYTLKNVSQDTTVTVTFREIVGPSYVITASVDPDGDFGAIFPVGEVEVEEGGDAVFTFTPDTGYEVEWIEVDGTPVTDYDAETGSYTIGNVLADGTIVVSFRMTNTPVTEYTVEATSLGGGTIDEPAGGTVRVEAGNAYTIRYTADTGFEFSKLEIQYGDSENWLPVTGASETDYTIAKVDQNMKARVTFEETNEPIPSYIVEVSVGEHGTLTTPQVVEVEEGESVAIGYEPDEGYEVDQVLVRTGGGEYVPLDNPGQTSSAIPSVTDDLEILITFKPVVKVEYALTATALGGVIAAPEDGSITLAEGESYTVEYSANDGYAFDRVEVNVGATEFVVADDATETQLTIESISANTDVRVYFEEMEQTFTVTLSAENAEITAPQEATKQVQAGDSLVIAYQPTGENVFKSARYRVLPAEGDEGWLNVSGANETGAILADINSDMEFRVVFGPGDAPTEQVTVTVDVTYTFGDEKPEYTVNVVGDDLTDEDRERLIDEAIRAIEDGDVALDGDLTASSPAGTEGSYTLTGPDDLFGDGYVVDYRDPDTVTVAQRLVLLTAADAEMVLGDEEGFAKDVVASAYEGKGGPVAGFEPVWTDVAAVGVSEDEPMAVRAYVLSVRFDREADPNPNYEIITEDGTLLVRGTVTYETAFPEGTAAENATFVDTDAYAYEADIILPTLAEAGFDVPAGLIFAGWRVDGETYQPGATIQMGSDSMAISAAWGKAQYTLTIRHLLQGSETALAVSETKQLNAGDAYTAQARTISGYTAVTPSVSGTMPAENTTVDIFYTMVTATPVPTAVPTATPTPAPTEAATEEPTVAPTRAPSGGTGGGISNPDPAPTADATVAPGEPGSGSVVTVPPNVPQEMMPVPVAPQYAILDSDIPLGGVTSRNVGTCSE